MSSTRHGKLIVLSGPSGVGKSTVVKRILEESGDGLKLSVSATTRPPRPGETDGVDYHFLSDADFAQRREAGEFLECIEVFGRGHWYGTLWSEVRSSLSAGKWVILEIDVDGAKDVLQDFPAAISIFIGPESLEELERRLRTRGTETEEAIQRRLAVARHELAMAGNYQYNVINISVEETVSEICGILKSQGFKKEE
ncbi:MAG: guanylate kinase [Lacipirellulaceae bacterium]